MAKDNVPAKAAAPTDQNESKPLFDKDKLVAVGIGIIAGAILHGVYIKYKANTAAEDAA